MRTLFLVLLLVLTGCSGGFDTSPGSGGHPFQDARGAGGSGGSGSGASSGDGAGGSTGPGTGGSSSTSSASGGSGGGCGDTSGDPLNCGTCGRSCLGAPCIQGLCASTSIAPANPTSLAVSGAAVVWGTQNGAYAASLDGSSPHQVPIGVTGPVPAVAGNASWTAFVVGAEVRIFDASATTLSVNQPGISPVALAADPGHIYWAEGNGHAGLYQLDTATLAVVEVAYPTPPPGALTVGDGFVCWTAFQTTSDGAVRCTPKDQEGTGAGALLESGQHSPCSIAVAGGKVFWTECPEGQAASVHEASDQDGSSESTLSSPSATAVATDGTYAYWADHGVFQRINVSSGVIEGRGVAPAKVSFLVAGADRLYWASIAGVHWVAK